jgi:hypothetical protein
VFGHVIDNLLHSDINVILDDAFIDAPDDPLDDPELLEQFAPGVQYLLRENILLAVDP